MSVSWRLEAMLFGKWMPLVFDLTHADACFKLGYALGSARPGEEYAPLRVTDGVNIVARMSSDRAEKPA